eukprot:356001-Chlamydomonas_euryale.AAC.3
MRLSKCEMLVDLKQEATKMRSRPRSGGRHPTCAAGLEAAGVDLHAQQASQRQVPCRGKLPSSTPCERCVTAV